MATKRCSKCKVEKELGEFYGASRNPGGLRYECKICVKKYNKEWTRRNPAYMRQYHRKNYETMKAVKHRKRVRVEQSAGSYTGDEWIDLCNVFNNQCLSCGSRENLEVDHVIPLAIGGSNEVSNLQPLCRTCNASKGSRIIDHRPKEFVEQLTNYKNQKIMAELKELNRWKRIKDGDDGIYRLIDAIFDG